MRTLYIELGVLCATRINYIWFSAIETNRLVRVRKVSFSGKSSRIHGSNYSRDEL